MSESYSLELQRVGEVPVAHLAGEVDLSNAAAVEKQLAQAAATAAVLVVDLSDVDYFDSTGFGVLERLVQQTTIRVVLPHRAVIARAFQVTGLSQLVPVYDSLDDALAGR
jgi:anti-sigma B factor antagonist